jgi:hypothetical protein
MCDCLKSVLAHGNGESARNCPRRCDPMSVLVKKRHLLATGVGQLYTSPPWAMASILLTSRTSRTIRGSDRSHHHQCYKKAVCRFFPIRYPASKHRGSTEFSILLNAISLLLPAWCFHPEQIWAGGGPQECGPFAIRHLDCFGATCSMGPSPGELSHSRMAHFAGVPAIADYQP